ncbi:IclR family transcriptional regulator [Halorhabdus amylolytica]|uniref:IclR family transcriptional regulator n=1 Tax=Halorhabdus amylolytica TaxID=2559573 RepID=UPI00145A40CC|nr:IclR family transcriptional regulator [Halorhabdus amylolytica]
MNRSDGPSVKAVHTSLDVLRVVADLDGAGVSEIASRLDRSKGGVYKHVRTLTDRGYLVEDGTTYRPGLRYWTLGTDVRDRLVPEQVKSTVDDLSASIGHAVALIVYEAGIAAVVYSRVPSDTAIQPIVEGDSLPLHATAAGKAVLAYLPEDERETILDGDLAAHTNATLTDPAAVKDALETVRERRLAEDHGEYVADVEAIAAPVIGANGYPFGSIAVTSRPEELLDGNLEADASLVVSASKSLENVWAD